MNRDRKTFGELLKQARDKMGISQEGLGLKFNPDISCDAAKNTICRFENGRKIPTQDECWRLAKILGVPPRTLRIKNCPIKRKTWKLKSKTYESRTCQGCGEEFIPTMGNQKYCTPVCRYEYWWGKETTNRRGTTRKRKNVLTLAARRTDEDAVSCMSFHGLSTEHFEKVLNRVLDGDTEYVRGER